MRSDEPRLIRTIADIEALEAVPLDDRLFSRDVNDWIRRGLAREPDKVAIFNLPSPDPRATPQVITHGELARRAIRAANLFRYLGVGDGDVVALAVPTLPELFVGLYGALAAGVVCSVNWMLKPAELGGLLGAMRAKLVVALGPTPGFEIWQTIEAIRPSLPAGTRVLTVAGPGGTIDPASDFNTLAAGMPDDRLTFTRHARPGDLAALVQSGGTTGAPKLVRITHGGLTYKCWANTIVMDHQPREVIFADYAMFHIAGLFGRGILPVINGMSVVIPSPLGARDKAFIGNYWKLVERYKISMLTGVPTTLSVLAKMPPTIEDLSSFKRISNTGSTAFPAEVARELERLTGVRVLGTYGATEYTMNVAQPPKDGEARYGSSG